MTSWTFIDVPSRDESADSRALAQRLQRALDGKTKPLGALGQLEALALQLGLILGSEKPALQAPQMVVFAGDHGIAAQGVSAYPRDVTWQMVENFLAGGAAVSVLARQHGLALTVVDAGVAKDLAPRAGLQIRKIAAGTADASRGPAMTRAQCQAALEQGAEVIRGLPGNAVLLGEMGIGNTSSAALLMSRLTGTPLSQCVGRGTGLDEQGVQRKLAVLEQALQANAQAQSPWDALAALGGFEIAMMCGAMLQAAAQNRVIVVDGFIATSALLVAQAVQPAVLQRCVFAHQSDESGHARLLGHLQGKPLLQLGLRLGEGSGAALAWPLLESACAILRDMASFADAGVSQSER
ncbi:MAG: nicotinate-nucleotide--dimethylbenzimidazole phosphoribosyltransferase [Acidobacteriota bacterium]